MGTYRATETFVVDLHDGEPEIVIAMDRAYRDNDKRIKQVIDRFPDRFESDQPARQR